MNERFRIKTSFLLLIAMLMFGLSGCGSFGKKMKQFLGGADQSKSSAKAISSVPKKKRTIKFSENPNVQFNSQRKYRRMTKQKFEKQANIEDSSGSLWVKEDWGLGSKI